MVENIKAKVRKYIAENILFSSNGYPHADDVSFLENGIVNSMNVMELVMYVEQCYGIKVEDQDITPDHFDSVEQIALFVDQKMVKA